MTNHEVDLPLGSSVADTIRALAALPPEATLRDHYGDADLWLVYSTPAATEAASPVE